MAGTPEEELRREIEAILPAELPRRDDLVGAAARHAALVLEANRRFNLTSVVSAREFAVKHVFDSLAPWRLFAGARSSIDLGSGAGFPGVPLACVFPEVSFVLAESVRKKARFLEHAARALGLANVQVVPERGEAVLRSRRFDVVAARAVGPVPKVLRLLRPVQAHCGRVLLYKGPRAAEELAEAATEARLGRWSGAVALRYELPYGLGSRAILEYVPKEPFQPAPP